MSEKTLTDAGVAMDRFISKHGEELASKQEWRNAMNDALAALILHQAIPSNDTCSSLMMACFKLGKIMSELGFDPRG